MANRYEIVEPEAMDLADGSDDVYHPNQSVREISSSVRSLEPILDGSIGLKTIFYDSRWSRTQRRVCVSILVVFAVLCFSLLVSLFVGLAKVISFIHYTERIKAAGLAMFPTSPNPVDVTTINFCSGAGCSANYSTYINAIDRVLNKYHRANSLPEYVDCPEGGKALTGKFCRFNLSWLGPNCTKENNYGYYIGEPCILVQLRNISDWIPTLSESFLASLKSQDIWKGRDLSSTHVPIVCHEPIMSGFAQVDIRYFPSGGFNTSFMPQGSQREFGKSVLPPLVMIQFIRPNQVAMLDLRCRIYSQNLNELEAIKELEFNFRQGTSPPFVPDLDYDQ